MVRAGTPDELELRAAALREAQLAQEAYGHEVRNAKALLDKRNRAMLAAYERGATVTELAAALGMSSEAASKAIGRPRGRRGRPAEEG